MSLTGIQAPVKTLDNIEPNTVLAVISDEQGTVSVVKGDPSSLVEGDAFLRVTASQEQLQSGCWVMVNGEPVWKDPCPY
jgi:hypothetical protein